MCCTNRDHQHLDNYLGESVMSIEAMKQEPVAYMDDKGYICNFTTNPERYTPLYTAPTQREWVSLTDEEIEQCITPRGGLVKDLARAIEAKLKEKNT